MFKADVHPERRHPRLLLVFASAVGLLMLAAGTAAAQGWSGGAGGGGRHGGVPYVPPAPPVPMHDPWAPGHHGCHDPSHHHAHDPGPVHVVRCDASFEVRPGMSEHALSLDTRGARSCGEVTGSYCPGYLARQPICLDVRRPMTLDIEVTRADVDTVLALTGPGLVRTDDDGGYGTQSRITQYVAPGEYRLYTGTYSHRARGTLSLAIRDADARAPEPPRHRRGRGRSRGHGEWVDYHGASCPAGSQVVSLPRWAASQQVSTSAWGEVDSGARMGQYQPGWVPSTAQLCLVVDEPGYYDVEVLSANYVDTVLGVVPAGGRGPSYFDDDGGSGVYSRVSAYLDRGAHLVYVGTYAYGNRAPATLAISRR
jgi:hypothetical protein